MLRSLALLAAAFALASCSGAITKEDCAKAGEAGTWTVSFSLSSGDSTCPVLEAKTLELPDRCEATCGCTEAQVVFEPAQNSALQDKCSLRFHETCPAYDLDCRDVEVVSANAASGTCFYKAGPVTCGYSVSWSKK